MDDSKRKAIGVIGGLSAIGGAAMGTGAFSSTTAERGVTVNVAGDADGYLALEPAAESPNASYASIGDDGQLQVEMSEATDDVQGSGVNPNAVTYFDDVFQVRNQGTQQIHVWIEHDSDHVYFEINSQQIETPERSATLDVGESKTVDIGVDTRDNSIAADDTLLEEITIFADTDEQVIPPGINAERTITNTELSQGGQTTVTITVDIEDANTVNIYERFDPDIGTASFDEARDGNSSLSPSFVDLGDGGGIVLFDNIDTDKVEIEYTLDVFSGAEVGTVPLEPNITDVDGQAVSIDGVSEIEVVA